MSTASVCPDNFVCTPTSEWVMGNTLAVLGLAVAVAVPVILWLIRKTSTEPTALLRKPLGWALTILGIIVAVVGVAMLGPWHLQLGLGAVVVLVLAWFVSFALVNGLARLPKSRVQNPSN